MNGYSFYSHRLDFVGNRRAAIIELSTMRIFLWENYGPGCELEASKQLEAKWAWDTDHENRRLYVNPDILTFIQLKFS